MCGCYNDTLHNLNVVSICNKIMIMFCFAVVSYADEIKQTFVVFRGHFYFNYCSISMVRSGTGSGGYV